MLPRTINAIADIPAKQPLADFASLPSKPLGTAMGYPGMPLRED